MPDSGKISLGIIDFSHSDPLSLLLSGNFNIVRRSPAELLEMVLSGKLDFAMVSLVSYLENREKLELVKGPTIHSVSSTMSTLLVSSGKAIEGQMDIAVTGHTRTTEFYMGKVLEGLGISYRAVRRPETAGIELLRSSDYALVIGDEALEAYVDGSTVLLDIGREFSSMFMLPPVYAVTVTTGKEDTVPGLDMGRLQESAAKHSGMAAKEASARLSLPEKLFENYYSRIGYSWDSSVMGTIEFVSDELDRPCDPNDAWRRPA